VILKRSFSSFLLKNLHLITSKLISLRFQHSTMLSTNTKSKREQERINKIAVLRKLNERKSILWPRFTSAITSADRQATWETIRKELIEEGFAEYANRDWKYLRDVAWKNWQSRFMLKLDVIRQVGNNGARTEASFSNF
jgi:hypothetical protein